MNAETLPLEPPKNRSGACFGGFRPTKYVEESGALARGAPLVHPNPQTLEPFYTHLNKGKNYTIDLDIFRYTPQIF